MADTKKRWVAIVTGVISVLIAIFYLALVTVLDSRGPMQPPPPEAMGLLPSPGAGAVAAGAPVPREVQPPG
ncbi:hypothetical protein [Cyanobium sp. HWJ4-Hawea]|uniref:hypothetical protein n=1 Tax=Cyanobium sp. HWJ4-Hawea TaxID=2823713 RepID=UPI0020CED3C0|nr:hypothetical protein [Cyanobium sp. HWJ4-Hawea]